MTSPIGDGFFLDAEVLAPLGDRLLEDRRQTVDLGAGEIGVERQPFAGELVDAGRGSPRLVGRRHRGGRRYSHHRKKQGNP